MYYDSPLDLNQPLFPETCIEKTAGASSNDVVLSLRNVGKSYLLWNRPEDRLKHSLRSLFGRWLPIKSEQYFREFWALRDINLELKKGETLGIIGKNGSGKSTLLQLICSTLKPTTGTVQTRGRVAALLELGLGFHSDFTGKENVYMSAAIAGLSEDEIEAKYSQIVEFADIGDFIDQPTKTYSSGMAVRLAFAVAAHVDADILAIDEALAVGDASFVQKCMRWLRNFQEHGTLIFVSHDTTSVTRLCDRVLLLEQGVAKIEGPPKQVCDFYLQTVLADWQEVNAVKSEMAYCNQDTNNDLSQVTDPELGQMNKDLEEADTQSPRVGEGATEFGAGGAYITKVRLLNHETETPLGWVVGGEKVIISVSATTEIDLEKPIIGFLVRDRLGQILFSENTYVTFRDAPPFYRKGTKFEARFVFRMPVLMPGDYSISTSVAAGSQLQNTQLHYVCDALFFRSETDGLLIRSVGIPMESITMSEIG